MASGDLRLKAAQQAIDSIGLGFDITQDTNFGNCKRGSRLNPIDEQHCRCLDIPGVVSIPDVPSSIRCMRGETLRIHSGVFSFQQMLEHFNQEMYLGGKIASGHFCASLGLYDRSVKDFATIKSLAYDGWFQKLHTIELERDLRELHDFVKEAVPSSWDTEAMARFIEEFGTHVVVRVSMGGKDVVYVRQDRSSHLQSADLHELVKDTADKKYMDSAENNFMPSEDLHNKEENIVFIFDRKGGSSDGNLHHREWLDTIDLEPGVISMYLLPLTSVFTGIPGSGFVRHAISLYQKYKPPVEDLHQFFEFQLPRQWAPVINDNRLGNPNHQAKTWLRFSVLGPKLYINTALVDAGNRPVIGMRFQLEGISNNRLAIHLQQLTSLPKWFLLSDNENTYLSCDAYNCSFHKGVKRKCCSLVCAAPVESDDGASIVTGAQLRVEKKCLCLRLRFSKVIGATVQKTAQWYSSSSPNQFSSKSQGVIEIISKEEQKGYSKPGDVTVGSNASTVAWPLPVHTPELQKFVDTAEMVRGPENIPGYWVVSGARLSVQNAKIYLHVKYSLLNFVLQSENKAL